MWSGLKEAPDEQGHLVETAEVGAEMSVTDVVDLATGPETVLMIVTMVTEDPVEDQGHQNGEDQGVGPDHETGGGHTGVVAAVVIAGGAGAVIVGVTVEVTGAGLTAGHDQEADQEPQKTNKNRLMVKAKRNQSPEVLHQLAIKKIQNRLSSA